MRKVILSLLFSGIGLYATGQNAVIVAPHNLIPVGPNQLTNTRQSQSKISSTNTSVPISQWYDGIDEALGNGAEDYNVFNNTIFSDSTVQALYGVAGSTTQTQLNYVSTQDVGEVFDPQSPIYDSVLSLYTVYNVDSVALFYKYHYVPEKDTIAPLSQNPDGLVHDTLIFQFYTLSTGGLTTNTITSTPPQPCAFPKYLYTSNLGTVTTGQTYKYILGAKDSTVINSTTQTTNYISVPVINNSGQVGVPVKLITNKKTGYNSDLFAFTVSYRPGFQWKLGDTIDELESPAPKHLHSHMRILVGQSATKDDLSTMANGTNDYEMSLVVTSYSNENGVAHYGGIRYNKDPYWDGFYLPGSAYNDYNQVLYSMFYVESPNDAAINQTPGDPNGYILGNVYPNPANGTANLNFALGNTEQVKITMYDMLGHEVATLANGQYTSGTHTISFNTDNLKEGVYMYSINAGSFAKTLKFTVVHN